MSATGRGAKRARLDNYSTPDWAIDAILNVLVPMLGPDVRVLEPAAGSGAIIKRLIAYGMDAHRISAIELDRRRARACAGTGAHVFDGSFIDHASAPVAPVVAEHSDLVITNPPYTKRTPYRGKKKGRKWVTIDMALAFAQRGLQWLKPGGKLALLLRLNWLEGVRKNPRYAFLRETRPYVLPRRPRFGAMKGTDACAYGWFVWEKSWPSGRIAIAPSSGYLHYLPDPKGA